MQSKLTTTDTNILIDTITEAIIGKDKLELHNASYQTGLLGYSLYYSFLAKHKKDDIIIKKAEEYFNKGIEALDIHNFTRTYNTDTIDAHLAHIGRFIIYTKENNLLDIDAEEYLNQLDDILFDLMKTKISIKDFDPTSGALAAGLYFLSRAKEKESVKEYIKTLLFGIDNFAKKDKDGDYFWESPSLFNRVYLGISHGSSLLIAYAASAHALNIETELCENIIEKASNFLLKQYRKSEFKGLFPNKIGDKVEPMQFALCYGDIGVGYALLKASNVLKSEKLRSFSQLVLEDCLTRTKADNLTLDAGILYGASGLTIAFHKVAQISKDPRFYERASYWYNQIGSYAIHNNDFAGFQSRLDEESRLWNTSYGWGILGIGVTLMAYSDNDLPPTHTLTFLA
ncbi:lantibiotic biosynthesis protein [Tenacibaculum sp. 190524A02b]|uniref:Lantibiotic biosynthesis protein n=1 Tax=Tenacibaculum vairaonense TaxID=3137860 RepID=A0ABP1FBM2_9FLAO